VGQNTFGIDRSGFTQMVYKLNGYKLMRVLLNKQLKENSLSFIEESEPCIFFDNEEGTIIHGYHYGKQLYHSCKW
jgi:hypothetical protein